MYKYKCRVGNSIFLSSILRSFRSIKKIDCDRINLINYKTQKNDRFDREKYVCLVCFRQCFPALCQKIESLMSIFALFWRLTGLIRYHRSLKTIDLIIFKIESILRSYDHKKTIDSVGKPMIEFPTLNISTSMNSAFLTMTTKNSVVFTRLHV